MIDNEKEILFTITPNRYEKSSEKLLNIGFIAIDK